MYNRRHISMILCYCSSTIITHACFNNIMFAINSDHIKNVNICNIIGTISHQGFVINLMTLLILISYTYQI